MSDRIDIEALLRHRAFVKALARSLVGDDARAEDVVQETYVAALRNPPRPGTARAWLAAVVRKLAWTQIRGEQRRRVRERKRQPPAPAPAPDEVMERAAWHQTLVNHVMRLPEPYRGTLLLRFFEELNSSEIATLQGVPAATVRTRIKRGLAQLRDRLDRETPGGRARWLGGLALLAWPERVAVAAATAATATRSAAGLWTGLAASLLFVSLLVWQSLEGFVGGPAARTTPRGPEHGPVRPVDPERAGAPAAPDSQSDLQPDSQIVEGRLEVTVLAGGRPAAGARVVVTHLPGRPWRFSRQDRWETWRRARTNADGSALFEGVPDGYVRVLAALPGHGRGSAVLHLPEAIQAPVVVELPRERPVAVNANTEVTLQVLERNGAPWLPAPVWDGRVLHGLAAGAAARVVARAPGYAPSVPRALPAEGPLEFLLEQRQRSVSWPALGAAPADGTRLVVRRATEETSHPARMVGGMVVAEGFGPGVVPELLALAPDGRVARLWAEAEPAVFQVPAQLRVTLRDTRGEPIVGAELRLFDLATRSGLVPAARTDRAGRASLPVYPLDMMALRVRERTSESYRTLRHFDPRRGATRMEITLPVAREVRVDGSLPPGGEVYVGREKVSALRFLVRPRGGVRTVKVHLLAPGHLPRSTEIDCSVRAPAHLRGDLEPAGGLELHVARRSAAQPYVLELEGARRRGPWRFRLQPGPDRVVRETMLSAGRFRVRDLVSGKASQEFAILPGDGTVRIDLDLTDVAPRPDVVRGLVTAPGGIDLARAEVLAGGRVIAVGADGTFAFEWTGAVAVSVRHPLVGETAAVTATRADQHLVLPLKARHHAYFRLFPAPAAPREGETTPRVRVGDLALAASLQDGRLSFACFQTGPVDVWIDVPGYAPLSRRVVLGEDLGTLTLPRGSSLQVRLLGRPGEELPDLNLVAFGTGYQRSMRTGGSEAVRLRGLGAGRFRVTAWDRFTGLRVWTREVDVDGTNDVSLEIDLR